MSTRIHWTEELPESPLFVVARDTFLSGWGKASGGSYVILPCDGREEADAVSDNARARSDMKDVDVLDRSEARQWLESKPHTAHVGLMTRDDAERWYEPGAFA